MTTRLKNPMVWLHGLLSGIIAGGSNSVVSGIAAMGIAPEQFNLNANLSNTVKMMGATFLFSGLLSAFLYLKQSPLPPITEEENENTK